MSHNVLEIGSCTSWDQMKLHTFDIEKIYGCT